LLLIRYRVLHFANCEHLAKPSYYQALTIILSKQRACLFFCITRRPEVRRSQTGGEGVGLGADLIIVRLRKREGKAETEVADAVA